jgi:gluconolactonase
MYDSPPDQPEVRVLFHPVDHTEGIACGPDGCLYAAGELGQVYRLDPADRSIEEIASIGRVDPVLGVAVDGDANVYVCAGFAGAVYRIDALDGSVDVYCDSIGGTQINLPNYLAFAEDGSAWLSDTGSAARGLTDGRLARIPAGGGDAEPQDVRPLIAANGLAVGADGEVYVVETVDPSINVYRDGVLARIAALGDTRPDGVAIDAEGYLLVTCIYPYKIFRVDPKDGGVRLLVHDHNLARPTNIDEHRLLRRRPDGARHRRPRLDDDPRPHADRARPPRALPIGRIAQRVIVRAATTWRRRFARPAL